MKIGKSLLLLIVAGVSTIGSYSQTLSDIVSKHIDAVGGKDKLASITSIRLEHSVQLMGMDAPSSTTILAGKGFRNESEFNGQKVVRVYTDKGGWSINPFAGREDPQALSEEEYQAGEDQIYVDPFFNYEQRGEKAELQGQEKVGSVNAFKIKLTRKDNSSSVYYIDPTTFYIVEIVSTTKMQGQDMQVTSSLSDYKKTDFGLLVAQSIQTSIGEQFSMTSKLNKVEINTPVDASIFEMKK